LKNAEKKKFASTQIREGEEKIVGASAIFTLAWSAGLVVAAQGKKKVYRLKKKRAWNVLAAKGEHVIFPFVEWMELELESFRRRREVNKLCFPLFPSLAHLSSINYEVKQCL